MFYINLPLLNKKNFKDRFDFQKFVNMTEDVYDILESYFALKVKALPEYGRTTIQGEESRPDLLSYRLYGTVSLWYILLLYNGCISMDDFTEGMPIKYPRLEDVEELYFTLNALQRNGTITGVV